VILTSAQYCLLPLDKRACGFNVHQYNYKISSNDSTVLVIMASAIDSSAQAIYDGTVELYLNNADETSNYIAVRG